MVRVVISKILPDWVATDKELSEMTDAYIVELCQEDVVGTVIDGAIWKIERDVFFEDSGLVAENHETISISRVFKYFCDESGKSKAYLLTAKRRKQGLARWRDALKITAGDQKAAKKLFQKAIDALCSDPFMQESGFLEWEQIFRSTEQFTKWIEIYDKPRSNGHKS